MAACDCSLQTQGAPPKQVLTLSKAPKQVLTLSKARCRAGHPARRVMAYTAVPNTGALPLLAC